MISRSTAALAIDALRVAWRLSAPQRNGMPIPAAWRVAAAELSAVASAPARTDSAPLPLPVTPSVQEVDVAEAARRLGVTRRAIQARCARGTLPARRIGRSWLVKLEEDA